METELGIRVRHGVDVSGKRRKIERRTCPALSGCPAFPGLCGHYFRLHLQYLAAISSTIFDGIQFAEHLRGMVKVRHNCA